MAVCPTGRTNRFHRTVVAAMIVGGTMVSGIAAAATPAAAVNDGPPWTVVPSPNSTASASIFDAISCGSPTSCMAVGGYSNSGTGPLIEQWDGSSWSVMAPGSPASGADTLQGVSCASATFCVAVGYSEVNSPDTLGALEQWNGTAWTVVSVPTPDFSDLYAVSCTGPDFCMAVGSEYEYPIAADPVVLEWNGSNWNSIGANVPPDTPENLMGVSCTGPDACQAVGEKGDVFCQPPMGGCQVLADRPITASWEGSSWTVSRPVAPHGGDLTAVSCTGPSACTAVGEHNSVQCRKSMRVRHCTLGPDHPLIETFDGSTWSVQPGVNVGNTLTAVSCSSPTTCVATTQSKIEEESGGGWSLDTPAVIPGSTDQSFAGVTCTGIGPCDMAGSYVTPGAFNTLVETRSG